MKHDSALYVLGDMPLGTGGRGMAGWGQGQCPSREAFVHTSTFLMLEIRRLSTQTYSSLPPPSPLLRKPFVVLMWQRPVPRESMPPFPELSIQTDVGDLRAASIHEQLELAISCSPSFPPCFPPSMPLFFLLFIYHI